MSIVSVGPLSALVMVLFGVMIRRASVTWWCPYRPTTGFGARLGRSPVVNVHARRGFVAPLGQRKVHPYFVFTKERLVHSGARAHRVLDMFKVNKAESARSPALSVND